MTESTKDSIASFTGRRPQLALSPFWLTASRLRGRMLAEWWLVKLGRGLTYTAGITASLALAVVHTLDPTLVTPTFLQGMLWLSWAQILTALGCSGDRRSLRDLQGLATLGRLRGLSANAEASAWVVGILRTLLWPTLMVGGILALTQCVLAESLTEGAVRLVSIAFTLFYFSGLGLVLAPLAMLLGERAGSHARLLFSASIVVPYFASFFWPEIPSIPGIFGWLLTTVFRSGGG